MRNLLFGINWHLPLNQKTQQDVRAIPLHLWDLGSTPFDVPELDGKSCWAGLDFGWRNDYAALVFVFPQEHDEVRIVPHFWVPKDGARDLRKEPARDFIARGLLTVTSGNSTDIEEIYSTLRAARGRYDLRKLAVDPANARKQEQDLMAEGFEVVEFYQTKRNFTEPWKWMMAALKSGNVRHNGNAVMRWMAGNTAVEVDGVEGVMPKKTKSAEKIDGICALAMALGVWLIDPNRNTDDAGGFDFW